MTNKIVSWQSALTLFAFCTIGCLEPSFNALVGNGIIFVAAIYAFSAFTSGTLRQSHRVATVSALAILGLVFLTAVDPNPEIGYYESLPFVILLLCAYVASAAERKQALRLFKCATLAVTPFAIYAIYVGAGPREYLHGNFSDSNAFGALAFSSCFAAGGFLLQACRLRNHGQALLWAAAFAILGGAAYGTHSRGAWVAAFLSVCFSLVAFRRALGISRRMMVGLACGMALMVVTATAGKTHSDLAQHNGMGASVHSRTALLASTIHMIEDRPVFGFGWGTWSSIYPRYRSSTDVESAGLRAHNDYLEAWAAGGVLGALEILVIPGLLFWAVRLNNQETEEHNFELMGACAAATLLVSQAAFNYVFHQPAIAIIAGTAIGVLLSRTDAVALPTNKTHKQLAVNLLLSLALLGTGAYSIATYLAVVPASVISNPRGVEARLFAGLMTESRLNLLAQAAPLSPVPYFAIAHRYTLAGATTPDAGTRKQDFDVALKYYRLAATRSPFDPLYDYRAALIYGVYPGLSSSDRYAKTKSVLQHALALDPGFAPAVDAYSQVLMRQGNYDEALKRINAALQVSPVVRQGAFKAMRLKVVAAQLSALSTK